MEYLFYKDNASSAWIDAETGINHPFGHYVFTFLNTINVIRDKETFINNESVWLSNNKDIKKIGLCDDSGQISKEKLDKYYDKAILNNGSILLWQDEFELFVEYMKNLQQFRNSETAKTDLLGIYTRFKYFFTAICSENYSYVPSTDNKRNLYFDSIYSELLSFEGFCLVNDDGQQLSDAIPCEIYKLSELCNIFILDFWEFLFNPVCQKYPVKYCRHCNSMYFDTNNKSKYCEVCRQPEMMSKIRYANRKANKARKLHQDVLTIVYGPDKKPNDASNAFLNESNYYWDIVQGKKPKENKDYSNRIKTEVDYINWLETKRIEYKKQYSSK